MDDLLYYGLVTLTVTGNELPALSVTVMITGVFDGATGNGGLQAIAVTVNDPPLVATGFGATARPVI